MAETQTALENMSSDQLKQLLAEQTSGLATPQIEVSEAAEIPSQTVTAPTEETPQPEEKPSESKETATEVASRKIKVEGKEVEIPKEKELEYLQKGYHYEKKMSEVKAQREELERLKATGTPATPQQPQFSPEQIKAELARRFETVETAVPTIIEMINAAIQNKDQQAKEERIADLQYDIDKTAEVPHWTAIKSAYERMRLLGESRESAFLKAENDYFKAQYLNARTAGVKEGLDKAKLKEAADIPGKGTKGESPVPTGPPTDDQLARMSSADLRKILPVREVED